MGVRCIRSLLIEMHLDTAEGQIGMVEGENGTGRRFESWPVGDFDGVGGWSCGLFLVALSLLLNVLGDELLPVSEVVG